MTRNKRANMCLTKNHHKAMYKTDRQQTIALRKTRKEQGRDTEKKHDYYFLTVAVIPWPCLLCMHWQTLPQSYLPESD